ncbi:MFS general substrate transporter [Trichoderma velutinum]
MVSSLDPEIVAGSDDIMEIETPFDTTHSTPWEDDPRNPWNWPTWKKLIQLAMLCAMGFVTFVHNFGGLCFFRFMTGFSWGPSLALAGPASALFILTPFLGLGLGPVIGSFAANRKGWRWTQWTMIFFAIFTMILHIPREKGRESSPSTPFSIRLRLFIQVSLIRPIMMLFTDPIITFLCLFFAAVPYVFGTIYHFGVEETGLVFLSIDIGSPEHRLHPAMIGSIGGPIGLFWFAWTAREDISWASPAAVIIPFAWGNLCIFVAALQYIGDTFADNVVASGAAANSLARYGLAAGFPLFAVPSSLIGFLGVALLPIPFIFRFDTIQY